MVKVASFGSITRDIYLKTNFDIINWPKTPSLKALVLPLAQKLKITDLYFTVGGNALNAAITFKRFGFDSFCVGLIGNDFNGQEILKRLKKEKINTAFVKKDERYITSLSILILQKGERIILNYPGANNDFNLKEIDLKKIKADFWYISLAGESYKYFNYLLDFAKKNNIFVGFNPTGYHLKKDKRGILKRLKDIDFLVLNEEEASFLMGIDFKKEKTIFKKLDDLMPKILAVTYGKRGSIVSDNNFIYQAGVFENKKILDRTGAGDAFGSGFLAGLIKRNIKNKKIEKADIVFALTYATANATSVVEKIGANENILSYNQFLKMSRFKNLNIKIKKINETRNN